MLANDGITGGAVYDALQLACARKIAAERIYTFNVRHFERIAPALASRIVAP
jgi:predicted nucleic acid-binding protein